ncbi:protein FAM133B-like [Helianthus annuus]|uniref:protein FAM133B-like n=1 Tax=Helianthus annuus TaxID=4232 RepID=UPI000B8F7762|nr:protein FAM133B-like [Helianthus annuus]
MAKCINLKENHKLISKKVEAQKDIAQLHKDLNQNQCWVYNYQNRLNVKIMELDSVRAEETVTSSNESEVSGSSDTDKCSNMSDTSSDDSESSENDVVENVVLSDDCLNDSRIVDKEESSDFCTESKNQTDDSCISDDKQNLSKDSTTFAKPESPVLETSVDSKIINDACISSDKPESSTSTESDSTEEVSKMDSSPKTTPLRKKKSRKNKRRNKKGDS